MAYPYHRPRGRQAVYQGNEVLSERPPADRRLEGRGAPVPPGIPGEGGGADPLLSQG